MGDAVIVDESAAGTIVHLHPDQKLIVKLPGESGSTGYRWKVVSGVGRALVQTDRSFQSDAPPPAPGKPVMVGGGGTAVFTFVAKHRGHSDLKLALLPPGRHRKPAKFFHVIVDIGHG
jgi:predicted secreted protein